jgi:hypothetical protein
VRTSNSVAAPPEYVTGMFNSGAERERSPLIPSTSPARARSKITPRLAM